MDDFQFSDAWNPTIHVGNDLYNSIQSVLLEIDKYFESLPILNRISDDNKITSVSPVTGALGDVLYLFYAHSASKNEKLFEIAVDKLHQTIRFANDLSIFDFGKGYTGLLWTLYHLEDKKLIEKIDTAFEDKLVENAYKNCLHYLSAGGYDYLYGGLSICMPLLSSNGRAKKYHQYLEDIVAALELTAIESDGKMYWLYKLDKHRLNDLPVSLGLSHGLTGIISILSKISSAGIAIEKCNGMIRKAVNFILNTKTVKRNMPLYPTIFNTKNQSNYIGAKRLGWCYGDLNIAIALLHANTAINDLNYVSEARKIIGHTIQKKKNYDPVEDGNFCHGASGVLQIYNRLNNLFPNEIPSFVFDFWSKQILRKIKIQNGRLYVLSNGIWTNDVGLITGVTGVGLTLLSTICKLRPDWDDAFLMNLDRT